MLAGAAIPVIGKEVITRDVLNHGASLRPPRFPPAIIGGHARISAKQAVAALPADVMRCIVAVGELPPPVRLLRLHRLAAGITALPRDIHAALASLSSSAFRSCSGGTAPSVSAMTAP